MLHAEDRTDSRGSSTVVETPPVSNNKKSNTQKNGKPISNSNVQEKEKIMYKDDLVELPQDDPARPHNWSEFKKGRVTMLLALTTLSSTFVSSSFSGASPLISREFGIGREVATLGISLYLLGYVFGPICWAPTSEVYGRRPTILAGYIVFVAFIAATGASKDISAIFITRFFTGVFGSAPVSNTSGAISDMYNQRERGFAIVAYSYAVELGPNLGPIVGTSIATTIGWRWIQWVSVMFTGAIFVLDYFWLPETRLEVITTNKARKLRVHSKQWALHSEQEMEDLRFSKFIERQLWRPLTMLVTEPVLTLFCLYNAFAYSIVYLLLESFPIVFEEHRGWAPIVATLPFLANFVGVLIGGAIQGVWNITYFQPKVDKYDGAYPELRLPPMILGGITLPVGFFLFGWLSDVHWIGQVIAAGLLGMSYLLIFQSGLSYIIDTYEEYASSAVAANTFTRSLLAAAFPLIARPMYHNLGIGWASSLLGFFSAAMACVPILFYIYGRRLRKWTKHRNQARFM